MWNEQKLKTRQFLDTLPIEKFLTQGLEFHHLDPSQKDFTISNDHFRLLEAVEESKKCVLICSNCHKELHDNLWNIEELNFKESEEVES